MLEKIYFIVVTIIALLWAASVLLGTNEGTKEHTEKYYLFFKITSWVMLILFVGGLICKILL